MRRVTVAALVLFVPTTLLIAQSPAPVTFEVASVKLDSKQRRGAPRSMAELSLPAVRVLPGGRVESCGHMLRNLIGWAYDINTLYQRIERNQEVDAPHLLEALRRELGLALVKDRATIDDFIIERVEPLLEN